MKDKTKAFLKKWFDNCKTAIIPLGLLLTMASAVSYFAFKDSWFRFVLAGIIVFIVLSTIVILNFIKVKKNKGVRKNNIIAKTCLNELKKLFESGDKKRVVDLGKIMAQNLYLSNCYDDRLAIGKIVLEAAKGIEGEIGRISEAHTLINDIGWTKALCNDYSALDDIFLGLKLLDEIKSQDAIILKTKAYRYLGSISITKGNFADANTFFCKAKEFCDKITDNVIKEKFLAGELFAEAEMHFFADIPNYQKAYELCEAAKQKREEMQALNPDDDRYVRSFAQKGKILYFAKVQNVSIIGASETTYEQIRLIFEAGLLHAKSAYRIDEIKKNSYGMACCLLQKKQDKEAQKVIDDYLNEFGDIELFETDDKLVYEFKSLKAQKTKARRR